MPTRSSLLLALSSGMGPKVLQVLPPPLVLGLFLAWLLSRAGAESLVMRPLRMPAANNAQHHSVAAIALHCLYMSDMVRVVAQESAHASGRRGQGPSRH
jgi:hypothetical protein